MGPRRMVARQRIDQLIDRRTPPHPTARTIVGRLSRPLATAPPADACIVPSTTAAAIRRPSSKTPNTGCPSPRWSLSTTVNSPANRRARSTGSRGSGTSALSADLDEGAAQHSGGVGVMLGKNHRDPRPDG